MYGVSPGEGVLVYSVQGCGRCPVGLIGADNYSDDVALFSGGALAQLTVVGMAGGSLPYSYISVPTELAVASTFYGSIPELGEATTLVASGAIKTEVELFFPLEATARACERLREGTIRGRAVVTPNGRSLLAIGRMRRTVRLSRNHAWHPPCGPP